MRSDQERVSQYEDRYQVGTRSDQVWQTRPRPSLRLRLGQNTRLRFALCPCSLTPTTTSSVLDFPAAPFAVGGIAGGVEGRRTYIRPLRIYPPTLLSCLSASRMPMTASRDWSYFYNGCGG
ncbi:hypothetical protein L208DRAFT_1402371 [Tricholoma matsutake]|nr:hypothetical protein L208DRAFT_1402371 [Tricholoma matsutake 945]